MPGAGELDKRVWIEVPDETQDSAGGVVEEWRPLQQVWAKIDTLRGQEQAIASGSAAPYDSRITIRWSPFIDTLTAKWRLRYAFRGQNIIFDVKSVPPIPDHDGLLVLTAQSGLTEG